MVARATNSDATMERNAQAAARLPFFDGSVIRLFGWPVETWLRCQAGMLKASEPVATGWIERRREAATTTLDALERLASCNDLQEIASIQRAWLEQSMKRLDSDMHAFADHAMALSQEAMSATRQAAQTSSEVAALAIQPVQRSVQAATEHAVDAAA